MAAPPLRFERRIGRRAFWLGNTAVALALASAEVLARRHGALPPGLSSALAGLFALLPLGMLAAGRAFDRGRPAGYGAALAAAIMLGIHAAAALGGLGGRIVGAAASLAWLWALFDLGLGPARFRPPLPVPALPSRIAAAIARPRREERAPA